MRDKKNSHKPIPQSSQAVPPLTRRIYVSDPNEEPERARMTPAQRTVILFMVFILVALISGLCLILSGRIVPF